MKLHELQSAPGSRHKAKRKGRGIGSGNGKTAGKGHKGQNARSGGGVRLGFEGGQNPIYMRLPKRGFKNFTRKEYAVLNLDDLNRFAAGSEVSIDDFVQSGLLKDLKDGVKILGDGEIKVQLTVRANKFSQSAVEKIQAAGGKTEVI